MFDVNLRWNFHDTKLRTLDSWTNSLYLNHLNLSWRNLHDLYHFFFNNNLSWNLNNKYLGLYLIFLSFLAYKAYVCVRWNNQPLGFQFIYLLFGNEVCWPLQLRRSIFFMFSINIKTRFLTLHIIILKKLVVFNFLMSAQININKFFYNSFLNNLHGNLNKYQFLNLNFFNNFFFDDNFFDNLHWYLHFDYLFNLDGLVFVDYSLPFNKNRFFNFFFNDFLNRYFDRYFSDNLYYFSFLNHHLFDYFVGNQYFFDHFFYNLDVFGYFYNLLDIFYHFFHLRYFDYHLPIHCNLDWNFDNDPLFR